MEVLTAALESRTEYLRALGPDIARQLEGSLQRLTAEGIKVEFSSVETCEHNAIGIATKEKCFGSYVRFKGPKAIPALGQGTLEGVIVALFPLAGAKTLTTLLARRFLQTSNKEQTDNTLKLSAFKEAVNILVVTYINVIANSLHVTIEMSIPKVVCVRNSVEFVKHASLRGGHTPEDAVSVGQFKITSGLTDLPPIKGRFIIVF